MYSSYASSRIHLHWVETATVPHLEQGQDASWRQLISHGALTAPQPDHQLHKRLAHTSLHGSTAMVRSRGQGIRCQGFVYPRMEAYLDHSAILDYLTQVEQEEQLRESLKSHSGIAALRVEKQKHPVQGQCLQSGMKVLPPGVCTQWSALGLCEPLLAPELLLDAVMRVCHGILPSDQGLPRAVHSLLCS